MSTRWKADGIPLWRKLFSSNWWWHGEVNPDAASLPPLEKRPKFWRGDVIAWTFVTLGIPTIFFFSEEINSRYWPFNHTTTYVGRIVETNYRHPQIKVELADKSTISIAFPKQDGFGILGKNRPVDRWMPFVDRLNSRQYDCPGQLLAIDAERWKFTFKPLLNIWEVRCASGPTLINHEEIVSVWSKHLIWNTVWTCGFGSFVFLVIVFGIIRRERKLYVKS
jgi:hypothetical protein